MAPAAPFDLEIHEMELCSQQKAQEGGAGRGKNNLLETPMDETRPGVKEEEEEKGAKRQRGSHDMTAEEQAASSQAAESAMSHWAGGQRWRNGIVTFRL